jgi:hypothetical protein
MFNALLGGIQHEYERREIHTLLVGRTWKKWDDIAIDFYSLKYENVENL